MISVSHNKAQGPAMENVDPAEIQPLHTAITVDNQSASAAMSDGPHTLPQEYLGGFRGIEASNLEAALERAKEASKACASQVDVRAFQDEPA